MYSIKTIDQFGVAVNVILRTNQNGTVTSFLEATDNTDYQAYLKWLEEGNTPLPADEQGGE